MKKNVALLISILVFVFLSIGAASPKMPYDTIRKLVEYLQTIDPFQFGTSSKFAYVSSLSSLNTVKDDSSVQQINLIAPITLDSSITVSRPLYQAYGAKITIPSGVTLTLTGSEANTGVWQRFVSGTSAPGVAWSGTTPAYIYPEWWGAVGDSQPDENYESGATTVGTDNSLAMRQAFDAFPEGSTMQLSGMYRIQGKEGFMVKRNRTVKGNGWGTGIYKQYAGGGSNDFVLRVVGNHHHIAFRDFCIHGTQHPHPTVNIDNDGTVSGNSILIETPGTESDWNTVPHDIIIDKMKFRNGWQAISVSQLQAANAVEVGPWNVHISNIEIRNHEHGILIYGARKSSVKGVNHLRERNLLVNGSGTTYYTQRSLHLDHSNHIDIDDWYCEGMATTAALLNGDADTNPHNDLYNINISNFRAKDATRVQLEASSASGVTIPGVYSINFNNLVLENTAFYSLPSSPAGPESIQYITMNNVSMSGATNVTGQITLQNSEISNLNVYGITPFTAATFALGGVSNVTIRGGAFKNSALSFQNSGNSRIVSNVKLYGLNMDIPEPPSNQMNVRVIGATLYGVKLEGCSLNVGKLGSGSGRNFSFENSTGGAAGAENFKVVDCSLTGDYNLYTTGGANINADFSSSGNKMFARFAPVYSFTQTDNLSGVLLGESFGVLVPYGSNSKITCGTSTWVKHNGKIYHISEAGPAETNGWDLTSLPALVGAQVQKTLLCVNYPATYPISGTSKMTYSQGYVGNSSVTSYFRTPYGSKSFAQGGVTFVVGWVEAGGNPAGFNYATDTLGGPGVSVFSGAPQSWK